MEIKVVEVDKPADVNVILGQSHFIKTCEDVYEALVNTVPGIKFGFAFVESSGKCLIRKEGTSPELTELAVKNALNIGAGHSFVLLLENVYPINVLHALKRVPEIVRIFAATANPLQVIVVETEQGRGILGVIDGAKPKGVEKEEDVKERREFLRKIGYKF